MKKSYVDNLNFTVRQFKVDNIPSTGNVTLQKETLINFFHERCNDMKFPFVKKIGK